MAYQKALSKSQLEPGKSLCVTLADKRIALFNVDGQILAIDDICTHDEASLAEGVVLHENGRCVVECPWHGAHFDLKSGAAVTFPAVRPVKTYPVRVEGDDIEIEM